MLQSQAEASTRLAMGQEISVGARKLSADTAMVAQFREAFENGPDRTTILDAIAAFEQTLLPPRAPLTHG